MKQEPVIGQIIKGEWGRDAIHIAVAPVVATEQLNPGQRIWFVEKGNYERVCGGGFFTDHAIGIVDPFLTGPVNEGDRFWMFLFPRTITSLRHEWTHPAFPEEEERQIGVSKKASEAWLRGFISEADCPDYETVIAARTALGGGEGGGG